MVYNTQDFFHRKEKILKLSDPAGDMSKHHILKSIFSYFLYGLL